MGGRGPLTSNLAESGGFVRTREDLEAPDVQFHMVAAMYTQEGPAAAAGARHHDLRVRAQAAQPRAGRAALARPDGQAVHPPQLPDRPGRPALGDRGRAPDDADRADRAASALRPEPFLVPASDSDADIEAHVRATAQTIYHPVGTCRMGSDDGAVVDPELRVRGVEALRVVDASVMPSVPRGTTNAPTIALAERAADLTRGRVGAEAAAGAV